eukprot:759767-Hanusia_phi.AAC.1
MIGCSSPLEACRYSREASCPVASSHFAQVIYDMPEQRCSSSCWSDLGPTPLPSQPVLCPHHCTGSSGMRKRGGGATWVDLILAQKAGTDLLDLLDEPVPSSRGGAHLPDDSSMPLEPSPSLSPEAFQELWVRGAEALDCPLTAEQVQLGSGENFTIRFSRDSSAQEIELLLSHNN